MTEQSFLGESTNSFNQINFSQNENDNLKNQSTICVSNFVKKNAQKATKNLRQAFIVNGVLGSMQKKKKKKKMYPNQSKMINIIKESEEKKKKIKEQNETRDFFERVYKNKFYEGIILRLIII